jgi:hypothetical protein
MKNEKFVICAFLNKLKSKSFQSLNDATVSSPQAKLVTNSKTKNKAEQGRGSRRAADVRR